MGNWTPGPWRVHGDDIGFISKADDQSYGMFCGFAEVYGENEEANARLISKAPELLEKLISAVGWMEHLQWIEEMNGRQPYPDLAEEIQTIHELIKEATGDA